MRSFNLRSYALLFGLALVATGMALPSTGCAPLSVALQESPACAGLGGVAKVLEEDAQIIAELSVELPQGQLNAALTSFINAKGVEQFNCAEQIAEALLGHPVAPIDAGPVMAFADAGNADSLRGALLMNKSATPGALERLQTFKSTVAPRIFSR